MLIRLKMQEILLKHFLKSQFPSLASIEDSLQYDKRELTLSLNRLGHQLGFNSKILSQELQTRLSGINIKEFVVNNNIHEITLQIDEQYITHDYLYKTRIQPPNQQYYVAVADIATIEQKKGFALLQREQGLLVNNIIGELSNNNHETAIKLYEYIEQDLKPYITANYNVMVNVNGQQKDEKEFLSDSLKGFLFCLLAIYAVLCWVFGSFSFAFAVILIVPVGFIGMALGHYVHQIPLSMFSVIGFIGMSGIIINDAIVFISCLKKEFWHKYNITKAFKMAMHQRLRAMFLTTATTCIGLLPLLFETSRQAQFLLPMAITLFYGLLIGFFLVLFLVPIFITLGVDIKNIGKSPWIAYKLYKRKHKQAHHAL